MPSPKNTPKNALGNSQEASPSPINQKKLTRELHAKPRDFTHIKQIISDIKTDKGAREPKLYNDIFRFPLFVPEWDSTAIAVLYNIITIGYKNKINFLKTVSDHNISSKLKEKRDLWIKYFCTTLRMGDNFSPEQTAHITELRQRLEREEDRFTGILRERWAELGATYKALWSQKGLPAETIFLNQHIVREKPEINIPYIDEFLCYNDSQLFSDLMNGIILESGASFGLWISARSDLLADVSTETYKLFCQMFGLGQEGLFDAAGNITQTALSKMPHISFESLGMVEQRKKEHIAKQESERKQQELREMTQQHIEAALAQEITGTCDADFILTLTTIPAGIKTIEITITRNGKTYARTDVSDPLGTTIDLKECLFTTFPSNTINQPWNAIKEWNGGDTYEISLCGKIGTKKTQKQVLHKWTQKKTIIKKLPDSSLDHLGDITQGTKKRVRTLVSPTVQHPVTPAKTPTPTIPTPPSLKKQEEEDLQVAIELLMEKTDEELQSFFLENYIWDDEQKTLTLAIPIEELEKMGYTPQELTAIEYGHMLQWTARLNNQKWIISEGAPERIKAIFSYIHNYLVEKDKEKKEKTRAQSIDENLGELGLPPSRRSTERLQKVFEAMMTRNIKSFIERKKKLAETKCKKAKNAEKKFGDQAILEAENQAKGEAPKHSVNLGRLALKIDELNLQEKGYRFFHTSTSITVGKIGNSVKKNVWSLTYNWEKQEFIVSGLDDYLLLERLKNALLRFLVRIDEEMTEEMMISKQKSTEGDKLKKLLEVRLSRGEASLLVRAHGRNEIITNISQDNYHEKVREIRERFGQKTKIYTVYRTYTYRLGHGLSGDQEGTYNQCIENDLRMIQARCQATLIHKSAYREVALNQQDESIHTDQERGPFSNGVAKYCKEFFLKKDPSNPDHMEEFISSISKEKETEIAKMLLEWVKSTLTGSNLKKQNGHMFAGLDGDICRKFFLKRDPNNLDEIADFMAFLQEKGTDPNHPGEEQVGIIYSSPVLGPISDIQKLVESPA